MKPIPELSAVRPTKDFMVYEVQSFTDPEKYGPYRVDKVPWYFSGACSCERFCCVIQPLLGKGNWTGIDEKGKYVGTTCKHIDRVDRWQSVHVTSEAVRQLAGGRAYSPSEPNI